MKSQIMGIDIHVPENTFKQFLDEEIQDHDSNSGQHMTYDFKNSIMKRSGQEVCLITVHNDGDNAYSTIVGKKDNINNEIIFTPMKIKNVDESFFSSAFTDPDVIGGDNDPAAFLYDCLGKIAEQRGGTFACLFSDGTIQIVKDGTRKQHGYLCCTDVDGHLYSPNGGTSTDLEDGDDDDDGPSLRIKTPINVWLQQNPAVAAAINGIGTIDGKMNYIGKFLVNARLNDEIDSSEFMDIFRQAGVFGFSDPSVLNFYKLLT